MKAFIVYDSVFGNTQKIAQVLAQTLGEAFTTRLVPAREATVDLLKEGKVVFIGSPTQQYKPTLLIQGLLERIPYNALRGVMVAAFDTRYRVSTWSSGSAAWDIARQLQHAGAFLVVPPESFFIARMNGPLEKGEAERAKQWATMLFERVKNLSIAEERSAERIVL